MVLLLTVLSGIAWTIVYIASIRVGFKQMVRYPPAEVRSASRGTSRTKKSQSMAIRIRRAEG
jgi:hypothetical protein